MKRNIINFVRKLTYYNYGKKKLIDTDKLLVYSCRVEDISYVASSNNIIRFVFENEVFYFKECRVHKKVLPYIKEIIEDYFDHVCEFGNAKQIKQYVLNDVSDSVNVRKLRKINGFVESHYETIKCDYNGWNIGNVGFPSLFEAYSRGIETVVDFMNSYCSEFIGYVRNEMYAYELNNYMKYGNYQIFRSSMTMATKKLGTAFGLDSMIPDSWYIKLEIEEITKVGLVTKECEGVCPLDLNDEIKLNISPLFQKEINRMNFFDAVCFQRDHKEENYFVDFDEIGQVRKIIALDNDSPMAFFPIPKLSFSTSVFCSPVCIGLKPNRPYIDREFYQIIKRLKIRDIFHCSESELPFAQRLCIAYRFFILKKIVSDVEVLDDEDWSIDTINKELTGEYGKTYLKHYIECDENQLIAEIMGVN